MRSRDAAAVPMILWVCAAVCLHYSMARTGDEVAQLHEDHQALADFAKRIGRVVSPGAGNPLEIDISAPTVDAPELEQEKEPEPPKQAKKEDKKEDWKIDAPKPEPPKPQVPKAVVVAKPEPPPPLAPLEPLKQDKRIAVQQHVQPNQEDNPNAKFVGDEANHVQEETVATQTSHDRDDANPTPAGNHSGPDKQPGDADKTKIADSDDMRGNKEHAPGEKGHDFDLLPQAPPAPHEKVAVLDPPRISPHVMPQPPAPEPPTGDGRPKGASAVPIVQAPPLPEGAMAPQSADVGTAPNGSWSFNPVMPNAGPGKHDLGPAKEGRTADGPQKPRMFGLGAEAAPGRPNLNLNQGSVVAVVGTDQLRKEREADGERRRSEHRGSWQSSGLERWKSAIENYVSSVKPGNQTALNTARVPFASYLVAMHNRIHPIFADSFLDSLDGLPAQHPLNASPNMFTRLEIILTKDGHLVKMGVVKSSGVTAFDVAALDSVQRASPFGAAPAAIHSPDGNVYLHWEFHRNRDLACSTLNAAPYMLKSPPPIGPDPAPKGPSPGHTPSPFEPSHETRHGALDLWPALRRRT
jgi:TonB family protein